MKRQHPLPDLEPDFRDEISEAEIETYVALARREAEMAEALKAALEAGDDRAALSVARRMVGLETELKQ